MLDALNMGPIPNRVGLPFARKNWIKRKYTDRDAGRAFIYPDFKHWATTKASERLEVGDTARYIFPYNEKCFLNEDFSQIGVSDGFGRTHWCKKGELKKVRERFRKDFSPV